MPMMFRPNGRGMVDAAARRIANAGACTAVVRRA